MRLLQYLKEEYYARKGRVEVFVNPSNSEMRNCGKYLRFTAINKEKNVYVWNGNLAIHGEIWYYILEKERRSEEYLDINNILYGEAAFDKGSYVMVGSDVLDSEEPSPQKMKSLYNKFKWVEKWITIKSFMFDEAEELQRIMKLNNLRYDIV